MSCLGYPSRSGYKSVRIDRFQAWDGVRFKSLRGRSVRFDAQKQFAELFKDKPGIVLSDIDPAYLNALLPAGFVAAPIDEKQTLRWSPSWHYGKPQAEAVVRRGLANRSGERTLFRQTRCKECGAIATLEGYHWSESSPRAAWQCCSSSPGDCKRCRTMIASPLRSYGPGKSHR